MFNPNQHFEFKSYGENAAGAEFVEYHYCKSESSARSKAGAIAKRINGPVDLAYASGGAWDVRYMTTASPSEFHVSGYRFERLD
jgi:hypothetical protein